MKNTPIGSYRLSEVREVAHEWEDLAVRLNHYPLVEFARGLRQATSLEQLDQLWANLRSESRQARQRHLVELADHLQACAGQVEDLIRTPFDAPEPLPVDRRYRNFVLKLARRNLEACKSWISQVRRMRYRDRDENGRPFSDVSPLEDVVLTEVLRILQDVRASSLP